MGGGALPHCDWAFRDAASWSISDVVGQLAWNVFVASSQGEATVIYDRLWSEDVERLMDPDSSGFRPEAVAGVPCREIDPQVGQLLLFNSRNLHAVRPSKGPGSRTGAGDRLTVSSFLGLRPDGSISLWS